MDSNSAQIEPVQNKLAPAWFRFLVPSTTDLIFIILLVTMSGGVLSARLLGDASIGWHIRNGEQMLRTHAITRTDPFSVTMGGQTWYAWEWLYDLVIAGMHHRLGLNGVVFFTAVDHCSDFRPDLALELASAARTCRLTALLLALSLGASMIHLLARPHVLSWLFTVIWFQLLDGSESADARSPAVMVFARSDAAVGQRAWRFRYGFCAARAVSAERRDPLLPVQG